MEPKDFANTASLNWALTHVSRFGENDILPGAFEYEAYKAVWPDVLKHLQAIDLSKHEVGPTLKILAPKGKWGYRVATQMDPFDYLLYTAMVHEVAEKIEQFRQPPKKRIACAYRVDLDANGQLFKAHSGWPDFHSRSDGLSEKDGVKYVVCADISDFYNQTSHHRIQNALSSATVPEIRAYSIELFLSNLASKHHSRGLPVGPSASILLAEACLADVDTFLLRKGYVHTRYVDDFRIFCRSEGQAVEALHDLTEYLYTAHRLTLQGNKTRILARKDFRERELVDPQQMESQSKQEKINELIEEVRSASYEKPDASEITIDQNTDSQLLRDTLKELFVDVISRPGLHVGQARYLLRRATGLRTRVLLSTVLDNLPALLPVLGEVVAYVTNVYDKKSPQQVGGALRALVSKPPYNNSPFVQYWTLTAFAEVPTFCKKETAIKLAESSDSQIRDRVSATIAKSYRLTDWVRSRKENWQNSTPFGQRAIIWAAPILADDERNHWLKSIINYPTLSVAAIARAVLAGAGKI
jgi:hypothetical protein